MKRLFTYVVRLVIAVTARSRTFNMKELGANPRDIEFRTELINQTIEKAPSEGGGTIYFPTGTYLTTTTHMKSSITLYVEPGIVFRFSDRFEGYLPFVKIRWEGTVMNTLSPLIYTHDTEDLTMTGCGTLNGNGFKWWSQERETRELIRKNGGKLPALNKLQRVWEEANEGLEISGCYKPSLKRRIFRPPFIQFYGYNNVLMENVKIVNSPLWTINPAFCDNVAVHGVMVYNPSKDPRSPNTGGINPSSCRNVCISDCFISMGDNCITIKSGHDADGRKHRKTRENITITSCAMLSGHGEVVIGSEMSGGVRRVTASNCVFDGTDPGTRLKPSRGKREVVEKLRVDSIVTKDIQRNIFIFDLFYDKESKMEPVSERTPVFQNIHLNNITGSDIKQVGYTKGIEEMPMQDLSFSSANMKTEVGFIIDVAEDIRFDNMDFSSQADSPWQFSKCKQIVLSNVRPRHPVNQQPIVTFEGVDNAIINNCPQMTPVKNFYKVSNGHIIEGHSYWEEESFKQAGTIVLFLLNFIVGQI